MNTHDIPNKWEFTSTWLIGLWVGFVHILMKQGLIKC